MQKKSGKKEEYSLKTKMFKNFLTAIIVIALVVVQVPAVFADGTATISAEYDTAVRTLSIEGNTANAGKKFVTVIIAPMGTPVETSADLANANVILKTVLTNANGTFDFDIVLPDSATASRYDYIVNADGFEKKSMFSTTVASSIPSATISAVNGGGASAITAFVANGSALGLDDGNTSLNNDAAIASYIATVKPAAGYTAETLLDAYMVGEGLSYVENRDITLGEFLNTYCLYLDEDYASSYNALPAAVQAAMNEAFVYDEVVSSFDKTFDNNLFVAEFVTSADAAELKATITDYMTANGISQAELESINNDVYEEKVFDELFKARAQYKTLSTIMAAYNAQVALQKAAAGQITQDQGSDSASSAGRGDRGGVSGSFAPVVDVTASFSDMAGHWSKPYVDEMYKRGVVNGFSDGSFKPNNNVTRAEFAKMIAQILGLNVYGGSTFTDVAPDSWYNGYVAAVEKAGIVTGTDGKFMPDSYITRQDAAVMLARVLTYKGHVINKQSYGFKDEASISAYAKDSVNAMAKLGLITGYDGGFAPKDNTTRGQAAALLMRVADYIK